MRAARLIAAAAFGLALLSVAAAWLVPQLLDWNTYRSTVEAVASSGLGRPVRIAGPIRMSLLPEARLSAGRVSVADTGDGASAAAAEIQLRVSLRGLLAGRADLRDLVLRGARMHLPWPLSGPALGEGRPVAGLHARLVDSTLEVGGLTVEHIDGDLSVDRETGTLAASGIGSTMGRSWRMTGRLGRPAADGVATLEVSLDGQGALRDTGGLLSGQLAADGSLQGQITGRGPDLSLLLAAPALPWRGEGRVVAGSGLVVADDLEVAIGGIPARGAVALRFLPQLRLDAALATSRLDLNAWLPPLLQAGSTAVPTGIDLSVEAAAFAGGTLRRLRAGFDVQPDGVSVREVTATLPGEAELQLSGRLDRDRFAGAARLAAPNLRQTFEWLRPLAPALITALPPGVLREATVAASVAVDRGSLSLRALQGSVDGAAVAGDVTVQGGEQPAIAANLRLTAPSLDEWLPEPPAELSAPVVEALGRGLGAAANRIAGLNADLTVTGSNPVWRGMPFDSLSVSLRSQRGSVVVRQAVLTGADMMAGASGRMEQDGTIGDGRLDLRLRHASVLGGVLPPDWRSLEPLFRGPATLHLAAAGGLRALRVTLAAEMADAEAQADGTADVSGRGWSGAVSLRHPGAPRLLELLGFPGVASWLGDGSLSARANLKVGGAAVSVADLDVVAGALRAGGNFSVAGLPSHPALIATIDAETLPLPLPFAHSPDPLPFSRAFGWQGQIGLHAGHVLLGLSEGVEDASATIRLDENSLRIDDLRARLSQGALMGRIGIDGTSPPHLTGTATLSGAVIAGPLLDAPIDIPAGRLDATLDFAADGYSPAGLLATLRGTARAAVLSGVLDGLDAAAAFDASTRAAANPAEAPARVTEALSHGRTPFDRLNLVGSIANGAITATQATLETAGGRVTGTGTLDLLTDALLARLAFQPADAAAPGVGLRLSGSAAAPSRQADLADLARWLAAR